MSEDKSGAIASWIWDFVSGVHAGAKMLKRKFKKLLDPAEERELEFIDEVAKSNAKNILLGLAKDDILVFGHTHRAFKDNDVINTGSWVIDPNKKAHTYVEINSGVFELKEFEQTAEKVQLIRLEVERALKARKRKKTTQRK